MIVAFASDHAGYPLKQHLVDLVQNLGHQTLDLGTHNETPVDYPDYARALGLAIRGRAARRGILICGSGVGASVAANKVPGVRAAICHDVYSAHQGVEHDDLNVLTLGARIVGIALAEDLVRSFLNAEFTREERHLRRLAKISKLEAEACLPSPTLLTDAELL